MRASPLPPHATNENAQNKEYRSAIKNVKIDGKKIELYALPVVFPRRFRDVTVNVVDIRLSVDIFPILFLQVSLLRGPGLAINERSKLHIPKANECYPPRKWRRVFCVPRRRGVLPPLRFHAPSARWYVAHPPDEFTPKNHYVLLRLYRRERRWAFARMNILILSHRE